MFLMEIESARFGQNLLSKIKKNLFWRIVKAYDKTITQEFGGEVRRIFTKTWKKAGTYVSYNYWFLYRFQANYDVFGRISTF